MSSEWGQPPATQQHIPGTGGTAAGSAWAALCHNLLGITSLQCFISSMGDKVSSKERTEHSVKNNAQPQLQGPAQLDLVRLQNALEDKFTQTVFCLGAQNLLGDTH